MQIGTDKMRLLIVAVVEPLNPYAVRSRQQQTAGLVKDEGCKLTLCIGKGVAAIVPIGQRQEIGRRIGRGLSVDDACEFLSKPVVRKDLTEHTADYRGVCIDGHTASG